MISHSKHHHIDSLFIYILAILSVLLLSSLKDIPVQVKQKIQTQEQINVVAPLFNGESFRDIKIKGKAYVVYDIVNQKVIAEKNGTTTLPLASITKVMTTITARTHYDRNKNIVINPKSIDGAYDMGLKKGQVWKLDEILKYTLVFSSNDGAQAVADNLGGRNIFVSQMNKDATDLDLELYFTHPAGSDENGKIGGKGSALSVAKLIAVAHKQFPELLDATTKTRVTVNSSTGKIIGIPNTNQKLNRLLGVEASKTGFTDMAGGNLVVIVNLALGYPVAIVVLGSTHEERFSDVEILYHALEKSLIK